MEHIDYADTYGMDDTAIDERLCTTATGVLALAHDNEAYAIPLAHYYDGTGLYFRLGRTDASRKQAFIDATETATYCLYGTEPTNDARGLESWSVIVTGRLRQLPASDYDRFDTAEINRRFAPIRVFGEATEDIEIVIYELVVETMTGRRTLE